MKKVELLAPAGDLQKLKFAIMYGADAVYIGGQIFGLRAAARNFSLDQMREGVAFAHAHGSKVYLTLNIIPHNEDLEALEAYIKDVKEIGFDAFILSDPGTLQFVKMYAPDVEVHLSTQANNTNYMSAKFWASQGVSRVILARELTIEETKNIVDKVPEMEFESFVHGAMCISYSGRCLLSNYMINKDANRGECKHPCRWKYHLVEEKRPGEYIPVVEDESGTYFFNSKDLCLIEHIPEMIEAGLSSLKIEGRMKSLYYVANVVRVYRKVIDDYMADPENYTFDLNMIDEIKKASHRKFTKGFALGKPDDDGQLYGTSAYTRDYDFIGIVLDYDPETGLATIEQRNKIVAGDDIEIMGPDFFAFEQQVTEMLDDRDRPIESAPHAQMTIKMKMAQPVEPYHILRKRKDDPVE